MLISGNQGDKRGEGGTGDGEQILDETTQRTEDPLDTSELEREIIVEESLAESEKHAASDMILVYRKKKCDCRVIHSKGVAMSRRHVETVVHNDDNTDSDESDEEFFYSEDLCEIYKLNHEIANILYETSENKAELFDTINEFSINSDSNGYLGEELESRRRKYFNLFKNNAMAPFIPKSLLDYLNSGFDSSDAVYLDNVITHVKRTIDQLKKISNGDYLTEKAKETWRKPKTPSSKKRAVLNNVDMSLVPIKNKNTILPFNVQPQEWTAIIESDINLKKFAQMFDKKIVMKIPMLLRDVLLDQNMQRMLINFEANSRKDKKSKFIIRVKGAPAIDFDRKRALCQPILLTKENTLENDSITCQDSPRALPPITYDRVSDEIPYLPPPPTEYTESIAQSNASSNDIIKLFDDDNFEDSVTVGQSTPSAVSSDSYLHGEFTKNVKDRAYQEVFVNDCPTNSIVSSMGLKMTMQELLKQTPIIEENAEDQNTAPAKPRVISPYENKKFLIEEKKRKKLLEIKQKREQRKKAVVENKNPRGRSRAATVPQASNSVTRLSITNKSFYNSIFGQKQRSPNEIPKIKFSPNKKDTTLPIPSNSDDDLFNKYNYLSPNEKRNMHKVDHMGDCETEVALLPPHLGDDDESSVDEVTQDLLNGTDAFPVKLSRDVNKLSINCVPKPPNSPKGAQKPQNSKLGTVPQQIRNTPSVNNNARHKVSVLECKKSIDKVYEFLHNDDPNAKKRLPKNVSFNKTNMASQRLSTSLKSVSQLLQKFNDQKSKPIIPKQPNEPALKLIQPPPPIYKKTPTPIDNSALSPAHKEPMIKKPKPLAMIEENFLGGDKYRSAKKKITDDEEREARGEAVRGPSITARLNALAQPRKPYVKALHEEIQIRNAKYAKRPPMMSELVAIPKPDIKTKTKKVEKPPAPSISFRRGSLSAGADRRLIENHQDRPPSPVKRPVSAMKDDKPIDLSLKKGVKFELDVKLQQVGNENIDAPYNNSHQCIDNYDEVITSSSSSESLVTQRDSIANTSTIFDLQSENLTLSDNKTEQTTEISEDFQIVSDTNSNMKRNESNTTVFAFDIFEDVSVMTAVEDEVTSNCLSQTFISNSLAELGKLEGALGQIQTLGTFKRKLIKNFTLTPKHSMQQVLLLHSGDTGSCIAPATIPIPSCLKITASKSDTVAELGIFPSLTKYYNLDNCTNFPMQITTVNYALQKCDNARNNFRQSPINLSVRPTQSPSTSIPKKRNLSPKTLKKSVPKEKKNFKPVTGNTDKPVNSYEEVYNDFDLDKTVKAIENSLQLKIALFENFTNSQNKDIKLTEVKKDPSLIEIKNIEFDGKRNESKCSLDILVKLLNEIQNISASQSKIANNINATPQENDRSNMWSVCDSRIKNILSITTLEELRQLDSMPSFRSFLISPEDEFENNVVAPHFVDQNIGVNFSDLNLDKTHIDAPKEKRPTTANTATSDSDDFFKFLNKHVATNLPDNYQHCSQSLINHANVPLLVIVDNTNKAKENVIFNEFEESILYAKTEEIFDEEMCNSSSEMIPAENITCEMLEKIKLDNKIVEVEEIYTDEFSSNENIEEKRIDNTNASIENVIFNEFEETILCTKTEEISDEEMCNSSSEMIPVENITYEVIEKIKLQSKIPEVEEFYTDEFTANENIEEKRIDNAFTEESKLKSDDTPTDVNNKRKQQRVENECANNKTLTAIDVKALEAQTNVQLPEKQIEFNGTMKMKRDLLVTFYSVLVITMFVALSLPEVLYSNIV